MVSILGYARNARKKTKLPVHTVLNVEEETTLRDIAVWETGEGYP